MKLEDRIYLNASKKQVWDALNDALTLKECIPGCSSLTGSTDAGFEAVVSQKIGPVNATFRGNIKISDIVSETSYKISGEGKGGAAGFAKGNAVVKLKEVDGNTDLFYFVEARVGGRLAQIGSRLIDGFAKKLAKKFFENFKEQLEEKSNNG